MITLKRIVQLVFYTFILSHFFNANAFEWQEKKEITEIFEAAGVNGTFAVYDVSEDRFMGHNGSRASTRFIPASTFKIANSLIGLSVGAVKDVDEILPYGGGEQFLKSWENDMSLRDAIVISNVPIYQELARRIGLDKMQENINKLNYGNKNIGSKVDQFWLDGPLEISAVEQAKYIADLAQNKLPFSSEHQNAVVEILKLEGDDVRTLYGKTGWQTATEPGIGWWVGWVKREGKIYSFALNIDMNDIEDANKRIDVGKKSLKALGIL